MIRGNREPRRVLQRADGRARAGRHAAGADHDLPRAGRRRDHGRAVSIALSMTLLPALMAMFADHLVKPGVVFGRGRTLEHGRPGGFWDRATRVRDGPTRAVVGRRGDLHDRCSRSRTGRRAHADGRWPRDQDRASPASRRSQTGSRPRTRSRSHREVPAQSGAADDGRRRDPRRRDGCDRPAGDPGVDDRRRERSVVRQAAAGADERGRHDDAGSHPDGGRGGGRVERGGRRRDHQPSRHLRAAGVRCGLGRARRRRHGGRRRTSSTSPITTPRSSSCWCSVCPSSC